MSWIAINDWPREALGTSKHDSFIQLPFADPRLVASTDGLLAKGSIRIEFDMGVDGRIPTRLVHFESDDKWSRKFSIYLNADYSVSVEFQQGQAHSYVRLSDWDARPTELARLTYAWDAPAKLGLLTIECLETGAINQVLFDGPVPVPCADAVSISAGAPATNIDPRVYSLAISDCIEPIGPAPSISGEAMIETIDGPRSMDRLQLGDKIVTANNGVQPIRWIVKQDLPTSGTYRPIKLRAPYFGLQQDITVAQNQRIMVSGTDAEYIFGEEGVLIEARQLLGHPAASLQNTEATNTYYQILLDNHDCILLNGAWAESIFIGRLADSPTILATSCLSQLPRSAMPLHQKRVKPMLRAYEARSLLDALSA